MYFKARPGLCCWVSLEFAFVFERLGPDVKSLFVESLCVDIVRLSCVIYNPARIYWGGAGYGARPHLSYRGVLIVMMCFFDGCGGFEA